MLIGNYKSREVTNLVDDLVRVGMCEEGVAAYLQPSWCAGLAANSRAGGDIPLTIQVSQKGNGDMGGRLERFEQVGYLVFEFLILVVDEQLVVVLIVII